MAPAQSERQHPQTRSQARWERQRAQKPNTKGKRNPTILHYIRQPYARPGEGIAPVGRPAGSKRLRRDREQRTQGQRQHVASHGGDAKLLLPPQTTTAVDKGVQTTERFPLINGMKDREVSGSWTACRTIVHIL